MRVAASLVSFKYFVIKIDKIIKQQPLGKVFKKKAW